MLEALVNVGAVLIKVRIWEIWTDVYVNFIFSRTIYRGIFLAFYYI